MELGTDVPSNAYKAVINSYTVKKAGEAKKKGWVTSEFVWPDKKVDIGVVLTGSKELDAEDASEGWKPWPDAAQSGHLARCEVSEICQYAAKYAIVELIEKSIFMRRELEAECGRDV